MSVIKKVKATEIERPPRFPLGVFSWSLRRGTISGPPAYKAGALPAELHRRTVPNLERVVGIEPTIQTWKDCVLPLHYTRLYYVSYRRSSKIFGGEGEIRTHETLRFSCLVDRCYQPLCHLSFLLFYPILNFFFKRSNFFLQTPDFFNESRDIPH